MRFFLAFLFLLLLPAVGHASAPAPHAAESAYERVMRTGVLRCGFVPWPPAFEVDPNTNQVHGPTKELFESIIGLTGWKAEFVQTSLGNTVMDLNSGRLDAVCSDGPWTISNIRLVDYTTWAGYAPMFVYIRSDDVRFGDYASLDDPQVHLIGIDGDVSSDLAAVRFPKAQLRTLINLTDPAQMLMEVSTGKADAVVLDPLTAERFMANNPGKIKKLATSRPLAVYPFGMSVRKGESALQQSLSRAIEMALNIGLLDQKLDLYDRTRHMVYSPARPYALPEE